MYLAVLGSDHASLWGLGLGVRSKGYILGGTMKKLMEIFEQDGEKTGELDISDLSPWEIRNEIDTQNYFFNRFCTIKMDYEKAA